MIREEAHKILEVVIDEAEEKKLFGQISFVLHFQEGNLQQITDKENDGTRNRTRTHR